MSTPTVRAPAPLRLTNPPAHAPSPYDRAAAHFRPLLGAVIESIAPPCDTQGEGAIRVVLAIALVRWLAVSVCWGPSHPETVRCHGLFTARLTRAQADGDSAEIAHFRSWVSSPAGLGFVAALGDLPPPGRTPVSNSVLKLRPCTLRFAMDFTAKHHSHLPKLRGGLFACAVSLDDAIVCVGIVGRPVARAFGPTVAEVTRITSDGTAPHAASKCLGALSRAALALGYTRLVSYTGETELGTTYRAANWHPTAHTRGGEWSTPGRPRLPGQYTVRKVRWEYGPDAAPRLSSAPATSA